MSMAVEDSVCEAWILECPVTVCRDFLRGLDFGVPGGLLCGVLGYRESRDA